MTTARAGPTLADRFEQAGLVVGSVFLLSLPTSALVIALVGFGARPWWFLALWFAPGLVVGLLLAAGRLPVTYRAVWAFAVSSYVVGLAGWALLGLSDPSADRPLALAVWVLALGVGALVARLRPVAALRGRLGA